MQRKILDEGDIMDGEGRVNIIVPMYNVSKYLSSFLDSVLMQTYKYYRLYIVDDCSIDDSVKIVYEYKPRFGDSLIFLKNSKNEKSGQTRNHGLDEAEKCPAEYTTFLDSDDIIAPDFLESMIKKAKETDADMVICGKERIEDVTCKVICTEAVNGVEKCTDIQELKDNMAFINPSVCNKLFRTACIRGVRFKNMLRSEDTCYLLEVLPKLRTIAYTNKVGYRYRLHNDSLTGTFEENACRSMFQGFAEMAKLYERPEYFQYYEVLETQVFIRCLIGGVCRASFSNMKKMKANIIEAYAYMNVTFPSWKRNPYLCFQRFRSKNKKEMAIKVCAYMHRTHTFGLFVWVYYVMLKVLKIDIRM